MLLIIQTSFQTARMWTYILLRLRTNIHQVLNPRHNLIPTKMPAMQIKNMDKRSRLLNIKEIMGKSTKNCCQSFCVRASWRIYVLSYCRVSIYY